MNDKILTLNKTETFAEEIFKKDIEKLIEQKEAMNNIIDEILTKNDISEDEGETIKNMIELCICEKMTNDINKFIYFEEDDNKKEEDDNE